MSNTALKVELLENIIIKLKPKFQDRLYLEIQRHSEVKEKNYEFDFNEIINFYELSEKFCNLPGRYDSS